MCSLCGVLGAEEHWTEGAGGGASGPGRRAGTPTQERRRRVDLANRVLRHYGLKLAEWQGQYVLRSAKGRAEVVPNLVGLWSAAERLAGARCDPLEAGLVARLERD